MRRNDAFTLSARWWRQFGFWGLTANAVAGLPALFVGVMTAPDVDWGSVTGAYTAVLATWAAAAGIREWGKRAGVEEDDATPYRRRPRAADVPPQDFTGSNN